jgi:hypothetical protein
MSVMLQRFWIQLTADRRRFGMLCGCVGVGLLLWARLIVVSNMPRTVIADGTAVAHSSAAKADKDKGSTENKPRAIVPVRLEQTAARDPFVISPRHYPRPIPVVDLGKDLGKSQVAPVEDSEQLEARLTAQLRSLVEGLKLEAAMERGDMAVIDGRTYRRGDWIGAGDDGQVRFRLMEVRQRSVILEHEDRRFELKIDNPWG